MLIDLPSAQVATRDRCGYRVVAESSSSGTCAQKLTELQSAFSSLSDEEKAMTFLVVGNQIYRATRTIYGEYSMYNKGVSSGVDVVQFYILNIPNAVRYYAAGTLNLSDTSSETYTATIKLCLPT